MKPLVRLTIGELLRETTEKHADLPAAISGEQVVTYRELDRRVRCAAKGLLFHGFGRGSHVAVWATDRIETLVCLLAAVRIGAVAILPNTSLKAAEMEPLLTYAEADILFYGDGYKDVAFPEIAKSLAVERMRLRIGIEGDREGLAAFLKAGEAVSDEELQKAEALVTPDDPAVMLFTSGTVGASKGVMTSHFSRVNSGIQQAYDLGATEKDRFLVAIPMFHCFSLSANIFASLAVGGCLCFPENRRTQTLLTMMQNHRVTVFHAVPTLFSAMVAREDFDSFDLSSLRIGLIGGAAISREQMQRYRERFAYELLPSLGLTEATAGITVAAADDPPEKKLTTIGRFMSHIEGRIVSPETGKELPTGAIGEICVRGYCVMQGYYRMMEQTAAAIDKDGFLHTGDLGFLDDEGFLHYAGRIKELIIRGGENIFPGEIEDCIRLDARVNNVRVIGVPDRHYGEVVCAVVCRKCAETDTCKIGESDALFAEDVKKLVSEKLAYYKVPTHVLFCDELPLGGSGKVLLGKLKEQVIERLKENGYEIG